MAKSKIREIVETCGNELLSAGRFTESDLVERVKSHHPEAVAAGAEELQRLGIATIWRETMRKRTL